MARSIKLMEDLEPNSNLRDKWWIELREEIKSHAKYLCCNYVIGYNETITILQKPGKIFSQTDFKICEDETK